MLFKKEIIKAFKNHNLNLLYDAYKEYLYKYFEDFRQYQYKIKDRDELIEITENSKDNAYLNWIDTSNIINMGYMFYESEFNGNISRWDVSNVEDMIWIFYWSKFNRDIFRLNLINITNEDNINNIFENCPLEYNVHVKQI